MASIKSTQTSRFGSGPLLGSSMNAYMANHPNAPQAPDLGPVPFAWRPGEQEARMANMTPEQRQQMDAYNNYWSQQQPPPGVGGYQTQPMPGGVSGQMIPGAGGYQPSAPMQPGNSVAPPAQGGDWFAGNMPAPAAPDPMQGVLNQQFGASAPGGGYGGQFVAPDGVNFMNDPGYRFRLDEGQRALTNSQFGSGQGLTGGAARSLAAHQQGLASQEYQNVFDRKLLGDTFNRDTAFGNADRALNSYMASRDTLWGDTDRLFNRNFSLASLGQNAAGNYGNNLALYGQGGSDAIYGAGNARSAGATATGNAINSGIQNGANLYAYLDAMRNRQTGK